MRPQVAILALMLVGASAVAADDATAPAATPRAVPVESSYDFGSVPPAEVLEHTFAIRNEGTAPLLIEKVDSDCKCTAVEFDHEVAPGAEGRVTAAVDTRVLNGEALGALRVHTNDPANAILQLRTKVNVQPKLMARPGYARWNTVQGEKEGVIGQTVWSLDGTDFHVLEVKAPDYIRASFRPATGDELRPDVKGSQWHVEAAVESMAPVGAITGFIEVVTDHPKQPGVRIPISGFVRPVVHVTPPTGDFGNIVLDHERKAVFFLQNFATEKLRIIKAETTVKGAKLTVVPVEDGRSFNLELILSPSMPPGEFKGAVRIRTDSPKAPLVEIPVSGTITKPGAAGASAGG